MLTVRKTILSCVAALVAVAVAFAGQKEWRHYDQGDGRTFQQDKPRLDRFAGEIKASESAKAYIIAYAGMVSYKNEARIRLGCIQNYLKIAHGIDGSRLELIDGGYRVEVAVRLLLVEPGDNKPEPYSLVNIEAVQMRKAPKYPCGKPSAK